MTTHRLSTDNEFDTHLSTLTVTSLDNKTTAWSGLKTNLDTEKLLLHGQRGQLTTHDDKVAQMIADLKTLKAFESSGGASDVSELTGITQETAQSPTGTVTFTGSGQWLTTPDQGNRTSGQISVEFQNSINPGWLSVFIRFSQNHLLDALSVYDITFSGENFNSASAADILFDARKSNFVNSSWSDSLTSYTNEDMIHIRFESTRVLNSNTGFKIAYRVIPNNYSLFF